MNAILDALRRHADRAPKRIALIGDDMRLTYGQLVDLVDVWAGRLDRETRGPIALAIDNGPAWAVLDLAALAAGIPCVPVPSFFTPDQVAHVLDSAGVGLVITDRPEGEGAFPVDIAGSQAWLRARRAPPPDLGPDVAKITFTSGTTGTPKGVLLTAATLDHVARSLARVTAASARDHHLAVLPLATLLENVAGIYAPLLVGAATVLPGMRSVGLSGSSDLDPERLARALVEHRATTAILLPAMLGALIVVSRGRPPGFDHLRFLAVGGAPVAAALLREAETLGLPVFQGYGLSECGSVVAVNAPGANRLGSVGRPLPHLAVELAADGEILIAGDRFGGYLGDRRAVAQGPFASGDIGRFDDDGFLYVDGRKKDIFITGFGRNISPAWVENALMAHAAIGQAAVFGEGSAAAIAVIVAAADRDAVAAAVAETNRGLPDYARVGRWVVAATPFTPANGLAAPGGSVRRAAIRAAYHIE